LKKDEKISLLGENDEKMLDTKEEEERLCPVCGSYFCDKSLEEIPFMANRQVPGQGSFRVLSSHNCI